MKYFDLMKILREFPLLRPQDLPFFGKEEVLRAQISRWRKQGKLVELKKGYFVLPPDIAETPNLFFVSTQMLFPSYVSLESALMYYGAPLIKRRRVTAVTPRKTRIYRTPFGEFIYQKIKRELFFDIRKESVRGLPFFIASPEKALLDLIYLGGKDAEADVIKARKVVDANRIFKIARQFPRWVRKTLEDIFERQVN